MSSDTDTRQAALAGVRVVEYAETASASFCARLLADAGADVVKVEPPLAISTADAGLFPTATPIRTGAECFLYLNANKRGVSLDLGDPSSGRRSISW